MPDWRNPANYAYAEKLSLLDWAWEFLRRSKNYQAAWNRFALRRTSLLLGRATPEAIAEDARAAVAPFGIGWPIDPSHTALEDPGVHWLHSASAQFLWSYHDASLDKPREKGPPWPGYPYDLALNVDLTRPVKPQVRNIELLMDRLQGELILAGMIPEPRQPSLKPQRGRFPLYLRLLDAGAAGASIGEMGRVLFPRAGDRRKSATQALASPWSWPTVDIETCF